MPLQNHTSATLHRDKHTIGKTQGKSFHEHGLNGNCNEKISQTIQELLTSMQIKGSILQNHHASQSKAYSLGSQQY